MILIASNVILDILDPINCRPYFLCFAELKMEKAFKKGFLLSESGSAKPKKPTSECNTNKELEDCSDAIVKPKKMEKAFKRGFLLNSPVPDEKNKTLQNLNQTELEEIAAQEIIDKEHHKFPMLELPRELLEHIFTFLDPNSIKSVVCVCKWWKEVVETPSLWKWARAKMWQPSLSGEGCTKEELYENGRQQLEIVKSNRLKFLDEIHLFETKSIKPHINELLLALVEMDNLKTVEFSVGIKTETIPENIAKLVSSVENFKLSTCDEEDNRDFWTPRRGNPGYNEEIIPAIMKELVSNEESKTKSLTINIQGGYILSHVDPDVFSKGVMKLEKISTQHAGLTQQQGEKILECLATEESPKLKQLALESNLVHVRPEILGEAIGKLTKLQISIPRGAPQITSDQVDFIFRKMNSKESALERLTLSSCNLKDMPIRYFIEWKSKE